MNKNTSVIFFSLSLAKPPNGERYPLVGGTRQRRFDGTNFKPRKMPENAQTPTSRVHAVLGRLNERQCPSLKAKTMANLHKIFIPLCLNVYHFGIIAAYKTCTFLSTKRPIATKKYW
jgi:hypothetical protein